MANQWFRLYSEFATDPKVQALSEVLQRRYIMLLCLKSNGDLDSVTDRNENVTLKIISTALRVTEKELQETKKELIEFGFIDDVWNINSWDKRQYISDLKDPTNKERQQRYRENKRNNDNAKSNGRVTDKKRPDTDTDTDIKKKGEKEKKTPRPKFKPPDEVTVNNYAQENNLDLNGFFNYYESNGWMVGKNKMKSWESAARGWHGRQSKFNGGVNHAANTGNFRQPTRNQAAADRITQDYLESCGPDIYQNGGDVWDGLDEPVPNGNLIEHG